MIAMKMLSKLVLVVCSLGLSSCGVTAPFTSDGEEPLNPRIATLDQLPYLTTFPVQNGSANLQQGDAAHVLGSNGLVLSDMTGADFDRDSSFAACDGTQTLRRALGDTARFDRQLCIFRNAVDEVSFDTVTDIYDGATHSFRLRYAQQSASERIFAFRVNRIGRQIETFELWGCEGGEQNLYLMYAIDGATFSAQGLTSYAEEQMDGNMALTGLAALNNDLDFTAKTLTLEHDRTRTDGTDYGATTLTLAPESVVLSGWEQGTWTDAADNIPYELADYIALEVAQSATLSNLAVLDGAGRGRFAEDGAANQSFNEGWDGATFHRDVTSDFIEFVENATIPGTGSRPDSAFTGDAFFSCAGVTSTVVTSTAAEATACGSQALSTDWINCVDIVHNGNGGGNQPEASSMGQSCETFTDCSDLGASGICVSVLGGTACTLVCTDDAECSEYGDFVCGPDSVCVDSDD